MNDKWVDCVRRVRPQSCTNDWSSFLFATRFFPLWYYVAAYSQSIFSGRSRWSCLRFSGPRHKECLRVSLLSPNWCWSWYRRLITANHTVIYHVLASSSSHIPETLRFGTSDSFSPWWVSVWVSVNPILNAGLRASTILVLKWTFYEPRQDPCSFVFKKVEHAIHAREYEAGSGSMLVNWWTLWQLPLDTNKLSMSEVEGLPTLPYLSAST